MTEAFKYRSGTIYLKENGIVYFQAFADDVYDVSDMIAMLDIMHEKNDHQPILLLMLVNEFQFLMTKEARNFFNEYEKAKEVIIAEAVVMSSVSTRILYNLLTRLHAPQFPFKAFNTEEAAVEWLLTFK